MVRVATIGRNGVPDVVPVCHVVENGKIYFSTDRDSKKAKNLGVHPRAAVVADLYSEDWPRLAGTVITGPATLIDQDRAFGNFGSSSTKSIPSTRASRPSKQGK